MIERNEYLSKLISVKENGFPKIIMGVRRCGKSYLLKEIYRNYLLNNGVLDSQIIIIELDDIRNVKYRNPYELDKYIREKCSKNVMNYIFIDEIQLVTPIINPLYTNGKYVLANKNDKDKNGKSIRKTYEIDFIAKKNSKKYYIQVCADLSSKEVKNREIRPFKAINDSFQKIIVLNKPIEESYDENGIVIIGISDFLLKFIK